jgi:hypothetical protein
MDTPHLHGYFKSQRGEFRSVPMSGERTLLTGMTWYAKRVAPAEYWNLWSDYIIHSIHRRVLNHIKVKVERNPRARETAKKIARRTGSVPLSKTRNGRRQKPSGAEFRARASKSARSSPRSRSSRGRR